MKNQSSVMAWFKRLRHGARTEATGNFVAVDRESDEAFRFYGTLQDERSALHDPLNECKGFTE